LKHWTIELPAFNISFGIPSKPEALPLFNLDIPSDISLEEIKKSNSQIVFHVFHVFNL
jgi:hypothetical protein